MLQKVQQCYKKKQTKQKHFKGCKLNFFLDIIYKIDYRLLYGTHIQLKIHLKLDFAAENGRKIETDGKTLDASEISPVFLAKMDAFFILLQNIFCLSSAQ